MGTDIRYALYTSIIAQLVRERPAWLVRSRCLNSSRSSDECHRAAVPREARCTVAAEPACLELAELLFGRYADRLWIHCRRLSGGAGVDCQGHRICPQHRRYRQFGKSGTRRRTYRRRASETTVGRDGCGDRRLERPDPPPLAQLLADRP